MTKKIIITADDYGMCQEVDEAIRHCIIVGSVSTTNVIVNLETRENARQLRTEFPRLSIGVHWNVTTGKPISDVGDIKSLVNESGEFYPIDVFKKRMYTGKIKKKDLETELIAQYKIFTDLCGDADYWNTHENSALCIAAFSVFAKIAKKFGIKGTRNFQRVYIDYNSIYGKRKLREIGVRTFVNMWFGIFIKRHFVMPAARVFSFDLRSKFNLNLLLCTLKNAKQNSIEIVVHPSSTANHPLFGNIAEERVEEFMFLTNATFTKELESNGLIISNFISI